MITRRFDRRSPSVRLELEAFKHEVWALEQAVAPRALALHARVEGDVFEVRLLPAEPGAPDVGPSSMEASPFPQVKSTG